MFYENPSVILIATVFFTFMIIRLAGRGKKTHRQILELTAEAEHELGWLPHGDPDVLAACTATEGGCTHKVGPLTLDRFMEAGFITPNEAREAERIAAKYDPDGTSQEELLKAAIQAMRDYHKGEVVVHYADNIAYRIEEK